MTILLIGCSLFMDQDNMSGSNKENKMRFKSQNMVFEPASKVAKIDQKVIVDEIIEIVDSEEYESLLEYSDLINKLSIKNKIHIINYIIDLEDKEALFNLFEIGLTISDKGNLKESSPLVKAVKKENIDIFRLLLEKGLDSDVVNDEDIPLVHIIYNMNFKDALQELINKSRNLDSTFNYNTILTRAINDNKLDWLALLIENNASNNVRDHLGNTPLHLAILAGNIEAATKILRNADIDEQNDEGKTALHMAIESNEVNLVELLLENNASIDIVDSDGNSSLNRAILNKKSDLVKLLLDNHVNRIAFKGLHVSPCFHTSEDKLQTIIIKKMIEGMLIPDMSLKNNEGKSTLYLAIMSDDIDIMISVFNKSLLSIIKETYDLIKDSDKFKKLKNYNFILDIFKRYL